MIRTTPPSDPTAFRRPRLALFGGVAAEWVKIWTLRSHRILVIAGVVLIAGSGAMFSLGLLARLTDPRFAGQTISAVPMQFVDGVLWAQILVAVLAVLAVSGEYASGQIRLSLLALPTRLPWLAGKAAVLAAVGFMIGVAGAGSSLTASSLILGGSDVLYAPSWGETLGLVLRSGLYLAAIAAFAVGVTAVLRNVVAALTTVLGMLVVLPLVLSSIPGVDRLADFMPTFAGRRLISDFDSMAQLAPWPGYGVLVTWAVGAVAVAGVLLKARDA
ncbi:hypothetical protein GCM10025768_04430 [Microbacterium pseudoresistens]|uniref:ABC-2 type transport system permease protein n=1 Tax=Microbacterium pseudoresistens TaxID=640634 RepID=A0A7Y9JP32_9MICO|nr:hypothetical protein [Microbacterium pseudoresistens]NYD54279.1 ABC-2 type transport system permease protein [Microbacterium pseudoresistens]